MSSQPKRFLTPEEYLEIERKNEFKSEYWAGEMYARAGAGANQNISLFNLSAEIRQAIRKRSCVGFANDMRVRVADSGLYTYPDVVVACDPPQYLDPRQDTLLNPTVIVEVLSPSTELYDRTVKFRLYGALPSLREICADLVGEGVGGALHTPACRPVAAQFSRHSQKFDLPREHRIRSAARGRVRKSRIQRHAETASLKVFCYLERLVLRLALDFVVFEAALLLARAVPAPVPVPVPQSCSSG